MVKKNGGKKNWGLKKMGMTRKNWGYRVSKYKEIPCICFPVGGGGTKKAKAKTQQV